MPQQKGSLRGGAGMGTLRRSTLVDTFVGTNGAAVDGRIPDTAGPAWISATGTIQDNRGRHTEVLGSEKIVNGTFGAALGAEWDLDAGGGTIAIVGGELVITQAGGASVWLYAAQDYTSIAGAFYVVSIDLVSRSNSTSQRLLIGTSEEGTQIFDSINTLDVGTNIFYFKALGTTTWITLREGQAAGENSVWDNILVKPITDASIRTLSNLGYQQGRVWFIPYASAKEWAGVVLFANDSVASTDGLFVRIDRTSGNFVVFMRVAGTDTILIDESFTYSEGAKGLVVYDAAQGGITVFYNKLPVGEFASYTPGVGHTYTGYWSTGDASVDDFDSKPLGYGADLFDAGAGTFESGTYSWEVYGTNGLANDANQLKITYDNDGSGAKLLLNDAADLSRDLVVGELLRIDLDARVGAGDSVNVTYWDSATASPRLIKTFSETSLTSIVGYIIAGHATDDLLYTPAMSGAEIIWLDNLKLLPVN